MASEYLKAYSKRSEYAVNFRREAGLNASVIEIINKGSLVVVLKENAYVLDGYKWDKVKYNNKSVLCFYPSFVDGTRFSWTPLGSIVKDMFNEDKLDIQLKDAYALKRDGKLSQIQSNICLLYELEDLRERIESV